MPAQVIIIRTSVALLLVFGTELPRVFLGSQRVSRYIFVHYDASLRLGMKVTQYAPLFKTLAPDSEEFVSSNATAFSTHMYGDSDVSNPFGRTKAHMTCVTVARYEYSFDEST
jgi:hypothetical protein